MFKLSPSILSADFSKLAEEVSKIEKGGADLIHVDVMDGHFVPNISFGASVMKSLNSSTNLHYDVHLMIENPGSYIDDFVTEKTEYITVHQEASRHLNRSVQHIKKQGKKAGVSINPATPVFMLEDIPVSYTHLDVYKRQAFRAIEEALDAQLQSNFLIHGVTASGKTQVYLEAIEKAVSMGKTAIMLVPEISLTKQIIEIFAGRFGKDNLAVLHSRLTPRERYDEWERIRTGRVKIVIGARMGVFAPLKNLGLIIMDEEHELSLIHI